MNAEEALFRAYGEWHRLAAACHKAASKRDWNFLLECQRLIRNIQPFIPNLTREARNEWKQRKLDVVEKENELRAVITELMALLESNRSLLQAARAKAISERHRLERAGRNLKRLESSYVLTRPPAWTSFS